MANTNWSREEHLVAFSLYCKIPFGKLHHSNPLIVQTAQLLGRTASALAMKLVNFARLDPALQERGIKGLAHGSKGEAELWNEFIGDTERLAVESELALRSLPLRKDVNESLNLPKGPTDIERITRVRLVQRFFSKAVLSSYNFTCSFCGIAIPGMLSASHIIPWKTNLELRADPRNGICLCTFHDRAFDRGILAVGSDLSILVSNKIKVDASNIMSKVGLVELAGKPMISADRFRPLAHALEFHRDSVFLQ